MALFRFASVAALSVALTSSFGLSTCRGSTDGATTSTAGSGTPAPVGDVTLAGVDTSALTPRERREWSSYVSEMLAPCADTPVSIAQCVREKRACTRCMPAAKYLVKEVREGRTREQALDSYKARFDNDRVKNIDVSDTPMKGPATAPITIVEWADFECPFCKRSAPMIESMVEKFPGKVRFYFKTYPLSIHPHAEPAAHAAFAAMNQGKFWDMHHKLFEKAPQLEGADLEKYAKELGLDMAKFKADIDSPAVAERVARDKKQADAVGLQGTPLVFINGREFDAKGDYQTELEDWIRTELELSGDPDAAKPAPKPAPPPTASVAAPVPSGK
jgi:protein-disulfide isomerase